VLLVVVVVGGGPAHPLERRDVHAVERVVLFPGDAGPDAEGDHGFTAASFFSASARSCEADW
jgi:hypothetical protein